MAGAVGVLVVLLLIVLPGFDSTEGAPTTPTPPPSAAAPTPALGDPTAIDLTSMTPREAADRLFDRVMRSVSDSDSVSARSFAPMAISAYDMVDEKDADLHYHVAVLHLVNSDAQAARQSAENILRESPNHLFGLYSAAQAELLLGNNEAALSLYRRFLDSYDAEMASGKEEYTAHANALPAMRQDAERILAARG